MRERVHAAGGRIVIRSALSRPATFTRILAVGTSRVPNPESISIVAPGSVRAWAQFVDDPMQAEADATLRPESDVPNQLGKPRIRAHTRKRRTEDEKVERGRAIPLCSLKPVPRPRIAQAGVDQRDVEGRDVALLRLCDEITHQPQGLGSIPVQRMRQAEFSSRPRAGA